MRQQQRENIRLKLVVSDEDDNVFGCDDVILRNKMTSCPSSCASLRMCYVNEAAFDDDYDDDEEEDCYHEQLGAEPLGSPDLIAGIRKPSQHASHVSTNFHHQRELGRENWVCCCGELNKFYWHSSLCMSVFLSYTIANMHGLHAVRVCKPRFFFQTWIFWA